MASLSSIILPNTLSFSEPKLYVVVEKKIKNAEAKSKGAYVALDMSQHMSHSKLDANDIGADFYYWSAHKHYGPTGIGVLLVKNELVDRMKPLIGGGMQVLSVTENTLRMGTWQGIYLFERRIQRHVRSVFCHIIGE